MEEGKERNLKDKSVCQSFTTTKKQKGNMVRFKIIKLVKMINSSRDLKQLLVERLERDDWKSSLKKRSLNLSHQCNPFCRTVLVTIPSNVLTI